MDEVQNLLQAFQALSAAILKARQAEQSVAPLIVQSVPLFARLRALYRLANLELQSNKASKALQRQEVDYAELELQNLAYERQHLEREIKRCEEYEYVHACVMVRIRQSLKNRVCRADPYIKMWTCLPPMPPKSTKHRRTLMTSC